ncbi:MAG: (2Fe-2S)-binding protein [Pseudomonadota bacterium]
MVRFKLNGRDVELDIAPDTPLLWAIRDGARETGTKYGCGMAQCGACTVHVNGMPRRSCVTPVSTIEGQSITTIEGVEGPEADAVRAAWEGLDTPQCGYCQSGQIMSAVALLRQVPKPTDDDINNAMAGNICRCATYVRIRRAIKNASETI